MIQAKDRIRFELSDCVKHVKYGDQLDLISLDGVGGVIWSREIPQEFQRWIDSLTPLNLPSARAVLPVQKVRALVMDACDSVDMPAGPNRDWFVDDVCDLAERYARVMSTPYLQLRFDVVADNACRKFHMDMVRARLICTYRGHGTQYGVAEGDADPQQICDVPTGAPILLRGRRWPDQEPSALRHRSPPIAGTGETRLILVLDAVQTLDDPRAVILSEPKRTIAALQVDKNKNEAEELA